MKLMKDLRNVTRKKATTETASNKSPAPTSTPANGHVNKSVTIEAKIDVGFGNTLYLRGQGPGLSWGQGIPLTCVDRSTWQWSGPATEQVRFKLLINDAVWAQGEDLVAAPGQRIEVAPAF